MASAQPLSGKILFVILSPMKSRHPTLSWLHRSLIPVAFGATVAIAGQNTDQEADEKAPVAAELSRMSAEELADYTASAEKGDADAQNKLGNLYRYGLGVPRDFELAFKWFGRAAAQSNAPAELNLGNLFLSGNGAKQSSSEAAKWFRRAAEHGLALAQTFLGQLYDEGKHVPQDYREAAIWYRRAAEQGEGNGQLNLAGLYYKGRGVPEDYVEAYKWVILSAAQGTPKAEKNRETVALYMTRDQIAEAQRRASAFVARKENATRDRSSQELKSLRPKSSGSGFFLTQNGYFITSSHVIEEATRIVVRTKEGNFPAKLVKADRVNDIALLKVTRRRIKSTEEFLVGPDISAFDDPAILFRPLPVVSSGTVKLGDSVVTLGFPNTELQGLEPKLTDGKINSLTGVLDDARHFQISVAVQPGNSGGPLINSYGNVVGVVTARLSDIAALRATGALPQNVNYAIKSSYALVFSCCWNRCLNWPAS